MIESGSAAFLQQAHRNNWQHYLASLAGEARHGWDICILTASDERQAAMYRRQLDWRRQAGLLPARASFRVIADPGGHRIGSGGATLRILNLLDEAEPGWTDQRSLIIHSGGDSRRLPLYSATGKLFARVPRLLPDGRASTIFDEFLISLSGLAFELPPGALIASGDVLLIFDHLQLGFKRPGVIGVAAATPVDMGTRHGVYASEPDSHRVRAYLHKPPLAELERWGAIHPDRTVQLDTGLVWLDAVTARQWAALVTHPAVAGVNLNLYGDLLLPLSQSTALPAYLADTSDGPATPAVQEARQVIWQHCRGIPFTVERLQPAVFIHFGTSQEYWQMITKDSALAALCGWLPSAAAWLAQPGDNRLALINAAVEGPVQAGAEPALVIDSLIANSLAWQGGAILAGLHTTQPLTLAANLVVHQLPVENRFVTRVMGLRDDPKRCWTDPAGTIMNRPWPDWLAELNLPVEAIWPDLLPDARTLWNARLYPLAADREESLRLAWPLQAPASAPAGWRERWLALPRLSLADSFVRADGERLLADLVQLEDYIASRHFYAAVEAEQPAATAKALLGSPGAIGQRRASQVCTWLQAAAPTLQLRGYKALAEVTRDSTWEDRAFATLAEMIYGAVPVAPPVTHRQKPALPDIPGVCVEAAARIDLGGGWTDTPPYSLEKGGAVLNAAIILRGQYPIVARATWLPEPRLILDSHDLGTTLEPTRLGEILAYANPADPFALPKAALVLQGLVPQDAPPETPLADLFGPLGRGLWLSTRTFIPRGSGLGTSSIMAGAVIACLARLDGLDLSPAELFDRVLCLEQMLTTGGGWQDQVGGLVGGLKLVTSQPGLPQQLSVEPVRLSARSRSELNQRLRLVYTGQQRLAKNLLRAVMGRWLARDPEMVWLLSEIACLARAMRAALETDDLDGCGELLAAHWDLNKRMDPGCSNPFIDDLFEVMRPYILGGKLAGAGGGGFALVITRDAGASEALETALVNRYPGTPVAVWPAVVPDEGLLVRVLDGTIEG